MYLIPSFVEMITNQYLSHEVIDGNSTRVECAQSGSDDEPAVSIISTFQLYNLFKTPVVLGSAGSIDIFTYIDIDGNYSDVDY